MLPELIAIADVLNGADTAGWPVDPPVPPPHDHDQTVLSFA
jgi:hypothetical protein